MPYEVATRLALGVDALDRGLDDLDHNATIPVAPAVREAMLPYLGACVGNPSSAYRAGCKAREAVDRARAQVAALLGVVRARERSC